MSYRRINLSFQLEGITISRLQLSRKLILSRLFARLYGQHFNPLSHKSDHENNGRDHTRRICLIFYQLLSTTSIVNEWGDK